MKNPFRNKLEALRAAVCPNSFANHWVAYPANSMEGLFSRFKDSFDFVRRYFKPMVGTFVIPKTKRHVLTSVFLSDMYESEERSLVKKFIKPDDSGH